MALYEQGISLKEMEFELGDMFVVVGKGTIGGVIRYFTKGLASHAGVITNKTGTTFEALYSGLKESHISNYVGQNILIVRPNDVPIQVRKAAINAAKEKWMGKIYPKWRLVPHLISQVLPFMGKINLIGTPVCSEVDTYIEWKMGIRSGDDIWGVNPDDLMDYWTIISHDHIFVYRGRLVA